MNNTQDLLLEKDILPLFDYTLNPDSKFVLSQLLQKTLPSVEEIRNRQSIIQQIIACKSLYQDYHYAKIEYTDSHKFLCYFPIADLKKKEYIIYRLQKNKKNILLGEYMQLIQFLARKEQQLKDNIDLKPFPKKYQEDLRFILNYLATFKPRHYKSKINKDKFGYKSIQTLNAIVSEQRNNGDTLLFFQKLNLLEAYISIAKAIVLHNFQFAELDESCFKLEGLYHPLLTNPVKNDLEIKDNVVLITGVNMSGKSTLLKTLGLCVYLTHLGLAIPAHSGRMPFYHNISIQINHSDDLKNGYSHFMNEIVKLKEVLHQTRAGKRCFAVFDELFKGTNYEDALAISVKTIAGLRKFDSSTFFISTHIAELEHQLETAKVQVSPYYVDCEIRNETPVFLYKIKSGWSRLQIGQLLFEKEGLNELLSE